MFFTSRPFLCRCSTAPRFAAVVRFGFALVLGFCGVQTASAKPKWLPISQVDLAATECKAYPGASAEVLLSTRVLDKINGKNCVEIYRCVKIYSPKGAEETGILHIRYSSKSNLWDLAARLTKADGTTTEFGPDSFSDSVAMKAESTKFRRMSIALPNLSAGDILELKWTQATNDHNDMGLIWDAQEKVPVRVSTFKVAQSARDFRFFWFNLGKAELKDGNLLEMKDLPPFESEPLMAPEKEVRGWYMIMFTNPYMQFFNSLDKLWFEISRGYADRFQLCSKPNGKIRKLAADLVRAGANDEEKLQLLYFYCRQQVENFDYVDSPKLQTAKEKLKKSESDQWAETTLERKTGYSYHVNALFAALAKGAGFEVCQVCSSNRNEILTIRDLHGWLFVRPSSVGVKVGNEWKLYAPGNYYMPPGMIPHEYEMVQALRCDEDNVTFMDIPVAPAAKSPVTRNGHFALDTDGTLEGDVEVRYEGHAGASRKTDWKDNSVEEIEKEIRSGLVDRLPSAEISNIALENHRNTTMPLIVRYKVKVPGYAEVAGTRIVLSPNYFEHGKQALFTAETRKFPIFFEYARTEHDQIEIVLPEGYKLDAPSAPVNVDQNAAIVKADYKIAYKGKTRTLTYERNFVLGANGVIAFQVASYPTLKNIFERINRSDLHSLVLKPKATLPAAPAPVSTPAAPEAEAPSK